MKQILFLLALLATLISKAQTPLSLEECEGLFQKNNLRLLAAHYGVEAARAQVIQARLWENPYATADLNLYNPEQHQWLDIGSGGQKGFTIQQLVYLGGKKRQEVALATKNAEAAALELEDLLRNLRFQLRQAYYRLYYNEQTLGVIDRQLVHLDTLVDAYKVQADKGTLPLRDLVRLQTLQISLRASKTSILLENAELRQRLSLLTASREPVQIRPSDKDSVRYERRLLLSPPDLEQQALAGRADLRWAMKQQEAAQVNLQLQKALAVPDLTLGAAYDQRSGAFNNQVNLTAGLPLRLWNRNQGNIRAARNEIDRTAALRMDQEQTVRQEVTAAIRQYEIARSYLESFTREQTVQFDEVYAGMLRNFQRRNISLIEFTDFMESYNDALVHRNDARKALMEACEQINLTTGTTQF